MGSSSAFSTVIDGHKVTAVGEVPPATVRFIADSVKAEKASDPRRAGRARADPGGPSRTRRHRAERLAVSPSCTGATASCASRCSPSCRRSHGACRCRRSKWSTWTPIPCSQRRHGLDVPVLLLDGTVVCRHRLDAAELMRLLRARRALTAI